MAGMDPALTHLLGGGPTEYDRRRSGYDAAKTTHKNRDHWRDADGLSPRSQLTPEVRRTLRNRARHEVQNGCYAAGAVRTLVGDTVGTGAKLQMLTPDAALNANVEALWRVWAAAARWPMTSRVMAGVKYVAGESFGVFRDSPRLARMGLPVTLDLRLYDPAQVADPLAEYLYRPTGDDGVECDADGEPVAYRVLKAHPGDLRLGRPLFEADRVAAADVVHWFEPEWPGQLRGVTPLAPALEPLAQLRRFTTATLTAAETAAKHAGVMQTTLGPDEAPVRPTRQWDTVDIVEGMLTMLPEGWSLAHFDSKHPGTQYVPFVEAKLREAGRALNMPFGKIAGDHSRYNYSSGRMDDAPYWRDRETERQALEATAFDPFLYRWFEFAKYVIPGLVRYEGEWWRLTHAWHYDGRLTIDPVKDATADELNLTNGTDTLAAIAARDGTDWEQLLRQRKREHDKFVELGLPVPPWLAGAAAPARPAGDAAPQREVPAGAA